MCDCGAVVYGILLVSVVTVVSLSSTAPLFVVAISTGSPGSSRGPDRVLLAVVAVVVGGGLVELG